MPILHFFVIIFAYSPTFCHNIFPLPSVDHEAPVEDTTPKSIMLLGNVLNIIYMNLDLWITLSTVVQFNEMFKERDKY